MVSPAIQGQVPHPLIVPEFLRSTSCGMTNAIVHGAIVYCLNSGSEGFVKGILETGGVMGKCVQMWTRNYGALGQTARVCFGVLCANRTREVKRDFGDLPIRRSEERVVNTPLVVKKGSFSGQRGPEKKKEGEGRERKDKRVRERERAKPALNGEKGLSPEIGVKKTMNAGGVDCEKCWILVSPVPARDEVCPHVFFDLGAMRCVPSCEKCWMQVSPILASDEVCPPVCASYEMCSCVSSTNLKCIMTFLLRERKDVLLEVAKELRVEIDITLPKIEFKKRICQSKYYDEESVKCLLEGILEEEREKQEIKEYEERRLARELELQRLRAELRNKLNENKLKAGNRINDLANVCILSGKRTAEVSEPVNKCRPLINPVVNKSVEIAASCDFEKENCDPPMIFNMDLGQVLQDINKEEFQLQRLRLQTFVAASDPGCEKELIGSGFLGLLKYIYY
ncbi:hypothetical protein TNCV_1092541 [Trichonephila clavipes]|nr:hypothetical protein TNCV_1092541 [Trichonephila clavipes]